MTRRLRLNTLTRAAAGLWWWTWRLGLAAGLGVLAGLTLAGWAGR